MDTQLIEDFIEFINFHTTIDLCKLEICNNSANDYYQELNAEDETELITKFKEQYER
jgi:hypothetical protein